MPDPSIGNATAMIMTSAATGLGIETLRSAIAATIPDQDADGNLPAGTAADVEAADLRRGGLAFIVGSVARRRGR